MLTTSSVGKAIKQQELSFLAGVIQNVKATLEDSVAFSHTSQHSITFSPIITPLDIYTNKLNLFPCANLHTNVYSTLLIIVKTWMRPRCPSLSEWINKLCCSVATSHPTLYDPTDCSTPGFPVFTVSQSLH